MDMGRKRSRKPKIVIKTRNGGYTKVYVNGKWQRKVTDIDFYGYVGNDGIKIECVVVILCVLCLERKDIGTKSQ